MKCVGIDIGSFSVKVAEIEASSNAYALTRFLEFPFSPEPQSDRQLQLIEILRSISAGYDAGSTRYAIAVPQHFASGRLRRFPFRERAKIMKSLAFELEDDIPLDPDETVFEAKIVEYVSKGADAWCVAVPFEAVREAMQVAADGVIDPEIVSVEGCALANLFERWQLQAPDSPPELSAIAASGLPLPERPARVIVSIGHTRTLVLVYRDGVMVSARSLQWGGLEVANALAATFSVPYFEALKILETKSFILMNKAGATRDQIALSESVSDAVNFLALPLKLALLETRTEFNLRIAEIELLGGTSQIQNLAPYLTQALEVPCNLARPLSNVRIAGVEDTPQNQASAALAVGLAIEALKRPRNPALNLRRGPFARQNQSAQKAWERWGHTAKLAGTAFLALCAFAILRDSFAAALADKAEEAVLAVAKNSLHLAKPTESAVQKSINRQESQIKAREKLAVLDDFNSALDLLTKITQKIPVQADGGKVEMNVHAFEVDNEDVFIQGTIDPAHRNRLQTWLQTAATAGSVKKAEPHGPPPRGAPGVPFAFTMKASRLP